MSYFNSKRIVGTNADRIGIPAVSGGWKELARTTLGSAGDTIDVTSLPDKRYYMVLVDNRPSGFVNLGLRLNADTGSNYSSRWSADGAADGTATSLNRVNVGVNNDTNGFAVYYIANKSDKEKLSIAHSTNQNTAGAGNAPTRTENVGKWANTSNTIDEINIVNEGGAGDLNTNSQAVVLGWDPADTHTSNFWEELASVQGTGSATNLSTGVINAKKYYWFQAYLETTSGDQLARIRLGNTTIDTGANYAIRYSDNGGADGSGGSQNQLSLQTKVTNQFVNGFIINNASNEKLIMTNSVYVGTAGSGNAPDRNEIVGKWANITNQADILEISQTTNNLSSTSWFKVWGAD